jgi:hypothetical protein
MFCCFYHVDHLCLLTYVTQQDFLGKMECTLGEVVSSVQLQRKLELVYLAFQTFAEQNQNVRMLTQSSHSVSLIRDINIINL